MVDRETERKRLVELIKQGDKAFADKYTGKTMKLVDEIEEVYDFIADHLLDNGIVVPPVKVGDKYVMDTAKIIFKAWNDVTGAVCEGTSWYYELESVIEDIVKLSFGAGVLYREEAEKALKGDDGK